MRLIPGSLVAGSVVAWILGLVAFVAGVVNFGGFVQFGGTSGFVLEGGHMVLGALVVIGGSLVVFAAVYTDGSIDWVRGRIGVGLMLAGGVLFVALARTPLEACGLLSC